MTNKRLFYSLSAVFGLFFILMAIAPLDRADWALENVLAVLFCAGLAVTRRGFPLSAVSYCMIFLFLMLHEVGAHYTYAKVPYDQFLSHYFGFSLNDLLGWERNNFDRIVHFAYGLLLAYPIREYYYRVADAKGFWGYFFPLELTMASSMMFELFEWGAAELFGGDLGVAYLGAQGDVWDAQKDMALATLGAVITMLFTLLVNLKKQRNFGREWDDSLRVKHGEPLDEFELE